MKTITEQHRDLALQYFESYPGEDILHISSDGQVFLNANKHDGANHQRSIAEGEPLVTISRSDLGAYAPAFDYESLTDEEKKVYDAELAAIEKENEWLGKIRELGEPDIKDDEDREDFEGFMTSLKGKSAEELEGIYNQAISMMKEKSNPDTSSENIEGKSEERPDNSQPGEQVPGQDLPPAADVKAAKKRK